MLLPAGVLQVVLGSVALYSISTSCRTLYFVYALYASNIMTDEVNVQRLRYGLGGKCTFYPQALSGITAAITSACVFEFCLCVLCALRISYHLHKNVKPVEPLDPLYSNMNKSAIHPSIYQHAAPQQIIGHEPLYYYSRPQTLLTSAEITPPPPQQQQQRQRIEEDMDRNGLDPNGAHGYYYSMPRSEPDGVRLQPRTVHSNYVRQLYEQ